MFWKIENTYFRSTFFKQVFCKKQWGIHVVKSHWGLLKTSLFLKWPLVGYVQSLLFLDPHAMWRSYATRLVCLVSQCRFQKGSKDFWETKVTKTDFLKNNSGSFNVPAIRVFRQFSKTTIGVLINRFWLTIDGNNTEQLSACQNCL